MARRSYRQFCGLAKALDIVGERWTLLIVRNLLLGPRRYSDLLDELPGVTTNLLAKRLQELEAAGLVEKERLPPPVPAVLYRLTADGAALEPAIMELARWGGRYLDRPRAGDTVNVGWGLLSMKRRYRGGRTLTVGIEVDDGRAGRRFELRLSPRRLDVAERTPARPQLTIRGKLPALRELLFTDGSDPARLVRSGAITVTGDGCRLDDLLDAFLPPGHAHLPPPDGNAV
jgi:DNA-binding HxlR family transcriptional regulator